MCERECVHVCVCKFRRESEYGSINCGKGEREEDARGVYVCACVSMCVIV